MTWQKSEAITELAAALAKAQGALKPAVKDSENPHFRSRYADLTSIWDSCREALAANDLSIAQLPDMDGETIGVVTLLMHKSGEWISGRIAMVMPRRDPQAVGSAVTYGRRYGLAAMIGVTAEDDDGEATRNDGAGVKAKAPKPKAEAKSEADPLAGEPVISEGQVADLDTLLKDVGKTEASLCAWLKYPKRLEDIRVMDYARVVETLAKGKKGKGK